MVFEFDSDGFLTDRSAELESGIYAAHGDLFAGARQINHDCHDLLFSVNVHNLDVQEILVATLFMRALEHCQATIILLGRGIVAPAKVTLRALIETVFTVRAVVNSPDALRAFILDDRLQRRKLMNKARQHNYTNLDETRGAITDEVIQELEQQIKSSGAKPLRTEDLSKMAGMHDWYTTTYALLSKASHTHVRELETYLKLGESDEIQEFHYAPSLNEIPFLILTAAHCLLIGASAFDKVFETGFGPTGDKHSKFVEAGFRVIDKEDS